MKKKILAFLTFCSFIAQLSAVIIEAPNLDQFEKTVALSDEETFVLFDVDHTLIVPKDLLMRPSGDSPIWNKYIPLTIKNPDIVPPGKYPKDYFLSTIFTVAEFEMVDSRLLQIISSLQEREIKTIAFTKMHSGPFGVIPAIEDWRAKQLKQHGIDFSPAFPHLKELSIPSSKQSEKPSVFKHGVLFCNGKEKGPVLSAFLESLNWKPQRIIFIDDRTDYLQTVEEALTETGIEFIGFHYTFLEDNPRPVDEKLAFLQLMHLAKTGAWLSDSEAIELMEADKADISVK